MSKVNEADFAEDLIYGAKAIGAEVGMNERKAFNALEQRRLPGFKMGGTWVARRSTLRQSILDRESAACGMAR
jgi:hypothetical protein